MFIVTYYVTIFYWKSLGFFLWSLDCKHSSALMKFDTMCIHHPLKFQSSCPTLYCLVIIFLNGKRLDWHKTTISDNAFLSRRKIVFKLSGNVRLLDVPILINIGITISTITPRGRHVSKKLDVKTFPFDSSTRGHWRYNGRKSHLSRPLSFPKGVLKSILFYIV